MTTTTTPKPTNLNMLFQQLITSYAHLVTWEPQTKQQFAATVRATYCESNPRNALFVQSILNSEFETIRLNNTRDAILFNQ